MAWLVALRWRRPVSIPEFLQFRPGIPHRSGTGEGHGDGRVCFHCCDGSVAGDLHGDNRREIAQQGTSAAIIELMVISRWEKFPRHFPRSAEDQRFGQRNSARYSAVFSGAKP